MSQAPGAVNSPSDARILRFLTALAAEADNAGAADRRAVEQSFTRDKTVARLRNDFDGSEAEG